MAEQAHSAKSMEGALRQLEERCADLREAASGHEERARGAAAEAAKAQRAIEKLMVCHGSLPGLSGSAGSCNHTKDGPSSIQGIVRWHNARYH